MGLFKAFREAISAGVSIAEARAIVRAALGDALLTMQGMVGNAGQQTVYNNYVVPEFQANAQRDIREGWNDVDIGEYMEFMGEIVEAGNQIMESAYAYLAEISSGSSSGEFDEEEAAELGEDYEG